MLRDALDVGAQHNMTFGAGSETGRRGVCIADVPALDLFFICICKGVDCRGVV